MNLDSLSFALSQISYSVANLTKKNFKTSIVEISHLILQHGAEADRHLFRCLFSHVDFSGDGKSSGKDFHQTQYLIQECNTLITKPNFVSTLCYALDNPLHHQKSLRPTPQLLNQLSKVLRLTKVQEVAFGLALLNSSTSETCQHATHFVKQKLPHLLNAYIDSGSSGQEGGLQDTPIEVLHLLLTHLAPSKDNFGISKEQREAFFGSLKKDFPVDRVPVVLAPLLHPEPFDIPLQQLNPDTLASAQSMMETSLADMIQEVGYGCTASLKECHNTLVQFGVRELNAASVARVLGMMAKTITGLTDPIPIQNVNAGGSAWNEGKDKIEPAGPTCWNVDVFLQVVRELIPHLKWREVVQELDHPGFFVSSKAGLRLLVQGLFRGLREQSEAFPVEHIYILWKNSEGQLSWITLALKNPDVFCFADYPYHPVNIELLKTPPDEENRDVSTWKSLDLVESLLRLSEGGHYQQVSELFKFPVQHCPDMLVLALLQIMSWNTMKHELLSNLMPIFLGNHPNSAIVLAYAWHCQGQSSTIRTLVMHSMAEWYMRGEHHDQSRLSRILDVAQDLKALSMLLNATPFAFVIDLACLASRREYLKLDKWLSDKIREHGEPFVQACVYFLKRRCPQLTMTDDLSQSKAHQLPPETITTMLNCLQACASNVAQELSEAILTMVTNLGVMLKARQQQHQQMMQQAPPSQNPPPSQQPSSGPPMTSSSMPSKTSISGTPLPGLNNPISNQVDALVGGMGQLGLGLSGPVSSGISSQFPTASLSHTSTPASPAKSFPGLGSLGQVGGASQAQNYSPLVSQSTQNYSPMVTQSQNNYSPLVSLTSQLHGLNMNSTIMSTGMAATSRTTPTLGGLGSLSKPPGGTPGPNPASQIGGPVGGNPLGNPLGSGQLGGNHLGNLASSQLVGSQMGGSQMGGSQMGGSQMGGSQLGGSQLGSSQLGSSQLGGSQLGGSQLGGSQLGSSQLGGGQLGSSQLGSSQLGGSQLGGSQLGSSQLGGGQLGGSQLGSSQLGGGGSGSQLGGSAGNQLGGGAGGQLGGDSSSIFPVNQQQFSKEIEDEANSYFQRIYNHTPHPNISIDEVLDMLKKFKDSPNKKERDVFACMLRNLFEEYRFFPQYPERELNTTAVLFGGIIEQGLVTYMDLGIALRFVLEALKKPSNNKMYMFGIAALDRFKTRLKDYPQYCTFLASIPHFPMHLREYVEYGARSLEPPNHPMSTPTSESMPLPGVTPVTSSPTSICTTVITTSTTPSPMGSMLGTNLSNHMGMSSSGMPSIGGGMGTGFGGGLGIGGMSAPGGSSAPSGAPTPTSSNPTPGGGSAPGSVSAIGSGSVPGSGGTIGSGAIGSGAIGSGTIGSGAAPGSGATSGGSSSAPGGSVGGSSVESSTTSSSASANPPGAIARPAGASRPSIANATNIDTLLAGTEGAKDIIPVPAEPIQDKIFFIFNNLSLANMDSKAAELKEFITDEHMDWVSQYLVMKRASIEHNFHTLYANFIDYLKINNFLQKVVAETFRNIKVLLRSDKGVANFSDRSLLKNLGHWLGMLTLAKNKPILHLDIDVKSLLYEAYNKGAQELLYVVPFVAKVLESCAKSKVFKPPNSWTLGIMNVFAELHQEPDLKLNLKFEIEVLCKNLNIDINDLNAGNYLKDQTRITSIENQLSAPSKVKESSSTPQPEEPLQINMPTPTNTIATTTTVTTTPATTITSGAPQPPQPRFGYHEINVANVANLSPLVTVNDQLALFAAHPALKQLVRQAIDRSVQELLPPVVERSMKIALTTCDQMVKKDFALDPEEQRMRTGAHHMVKFMTAGMALITCREPLLLSITNNLKSAFLTAMQGATQQQKDLVEQAAQQVAGDNVELACAFIQKTAVEKALPEMDKRLAHEYELRKEARDVGRRYCEPVVLTYQAERMPEQIRLKVGGVTHQQIAVYEEFARSTPGFLPTAQEASPSAYMVRPNQNFATDEITQIYDKIVADIEQHLRVMLLPTNHALHTTLRALLEQVMVSRNSRDIVTAQNLLQKAVEGLLEGLTIPQDQEVLLRYRDCHLLVLKGLQDHRAYGPQWTNKQVTRVLVECREEYRYSIDAVDCLIRSQLVTMQQYDQHLAGSMENGLNYMGVAFGMQLVQRFCVEGDKHGNIEADFFTTIEMLARIAAHSRQAPEGLTNLIESIRTQNDGSLLDRQPNGPTSMMHSGISQAREFDDPPGLHDKTEYLLREWVTLFHSSAAGRDSSKAFTAIVTQMHQQGILKSDDLITRFFRLCTEMCVDLCYRALADQQHGSTLIRNKCFHTLDAFVRLIALLVKHSGENTNTVTKINLLNKVLGIVAGVLLQDHEVRHTEFQQLPYHRIFIMLFIELNAPEHVLESINYQVLTAFGNTFHILRPAKAPGFAYAWLELVSHRVFIGRMLAITSQQRQGWNIYAQLLIDLFKFLAPFLRNAEMNKPTHLLYKGTLRVLLVLLHDFPEFLCDYHYVFCDVVPPNCIQMRNLILSAFPRNMRLPDPFTPNLKVDMLPEISHTPRIMTNFANMIQPATFKKDLDSYLKTRSPVTFLSELRSKLQVSSEPGMRYNIPLINALVLYVGTQAIQYIHQKGHTPSMSTIAHSAHMDIFQNLAVDLDTEGRYLFLNAISNQLRYPNSHTHYFSCTLLYLFAEANTESIQEQITRVLLERLIVNRPHPWGLLITFIELIKNPNFKFWNHEFVHCAPEIEKLFDSVARSCMQPKQATGLREGEAQ